jgi:predicted amidohydrolase YtcJ
MKFCRHKIYWPENALSTEDSLPGMKTRIAKSNFEENEKGGIENGRFADFIVIDKDLMRTDAKDILSTNILMTFVNGENVFERK